MIVLKPPTWGSGPFHYPVGDLACIPIKRELRTILVNIFSVVVTLSIALPLMKNILLQISVFFRLLAVSFNLPFKSGSHQSL